MEIVVLILMGIGGLMLVAGNIWFLVEMFRTSILWGLGGLFVPFVTLIWLVLHWDQGAKPFGLSILGAVVCILTAIFGQGYL